MKFFGKNDITVEDKGSSIFDYLENIEASVICQLFLNCNKQLTKAEVKESQTIPSGRIY